MASTGITFGMVAVSSAIFLLVTTLTTCQGKPYATLDSTNPGNEVTNNGFAKPVEYSKMGPNYDLRGSRKPEGDNFQEDTDTEDEDNSSEERRNEIWNNVPWSYSRFSKYQGTNPSWQSSSSGGGGSGGLTFSQQSQLQPLMHKRYSILENGQKGADVPFVQEHDGILSNYMRNSAGAATSPNGLGSPGFRLRPMNYNFRSGQGTGGGRVSGFLSSPISPRKRQILFRQCFFNPISCF